MVLDCPAVAPLSRDDGGLQHNAQGEARENRYTKTWPLYLECDVCGRALGAALATDAECDAIFAVVMLDSLRDVGCGRGICKYKKR